MKNISVFLTILFFLTTKAMDDEAVRAKKTEEFARAQATWRRLCSEYEACYDRCVEERRGEGTCKRSCQKRLDETIRMMK